MAGAVELEHGGRKSIAGAGGSGVARLVLVPEISPYAHLKHLDVHAIGIRAP